MIVTEKQAPEKKSGGNGLLIGLAVVGVVGLVGAGGYCYMRKKKNANEGGYKSTLLINKVEMA